MKQKIILFTVIVFQYLLMAANYPDQHIEYKNMENLFYNAVEISNIQLNADKNQLELKSGEKFGYIILPPDSSEQPFNEGLPSWNGFAPRNTNSSFAIQMRFPSGSNWSPWLTVGYWQKDIWGNNYGATSWSDGKVDVDVVKLYSYKSKWQFKVVMSRTDVTLESPNINKLSFFASDSRTTDVFSVIQAINDNPDPIFIETEFYYQYGLDDEIGGEICSPTSVSMILRSFGIELDPVQFARDNYDEHWGMFGVWPRVVQNASEFGVDGAVTRYRNWSDTREVLAKGGRIAISVGPPLYSGHLMMLAGFNENGYPIIHDPAQSGGYSYMFNKGELSRSWFEKGGVSYTFYLKDSTTSIDDDAINLPDENKVLWNYPNPFNNSTTICYKIKNQGLYDLKIFDLQGEIVLSKKLGDLSIGNYDFDWNIENLASGVYIARLSGNHFVSLTRMIFLK